MSQVDVLQNSSGGLRAIPATTRVNDGGRLGSFRIVRERPTNSHVWTSRVILHLLGQKTIPVAIYAVAASLLPGGLTAHSVLKIPIPCFPDSVCSTSLDSSSSLEIRDSSFIVWDESVLCSRYCIGAVDRTL